MRKLIFILFFLCLSIGSFSNNYNGTKDTCNIQKIKVSTKREIATKIFHCFNTREFDSLIIFLENPIEFSVIKDSITIIEDKLTDYHTILNLNSIIEAVNPHSCRIISGKNRKNEDVLVLEMLIYEQEEKYILNISFILDYKGAIHKIIIY